MFIVPLTLLSVHIVNDCTVNSVWSRSKPSVLSLWVGVLFHVAYIKSGRTDRDTNSPTTLHQSPVENFWHQNVWKTKYNLSWTWHIWQVHLNFGLYLLKFKNYIFGLFVHLCILFVYLFTYNLLFSNCIYFMCVQIFPNTLKVQSAYMELVIIIIFWITLIYVRKIYWAKIKKYIMQNILLHTL